MCPIFIGQSVNIPSKDPNGQFVRVRQDFFALTVICQIIFSTKSYFVQPNVVCLEPAIPTFWTPEHKYRGSPSGRETNIFLN